MRLSFRSVSWVVALVGWMSAVAAPEVQCDELDVLLQDYREYELPLPPQDAQLATQEPDRPRVVYGVRQRWCTVLLIRPSDGSSRPVYLGGLQQVEAGPDEEIRVVPPQLESLKGTKPFASDWWRRRFPEFPDLALAVQCKSLGWDEVALELLARSHKRRQGYYLGNRRPRDHRDALAKMAWNYNCTQFASADADERRAILAHMKHLLTTRPIVDTKANRTLIADIEATFAATPSAPDSLEAAIDGLLELDAIPQNRQAKFELSRFIKSNPHAQRLQRAGWTAVPVLMEHLDDFRVTRLTPTTMYGEYDWHARIADVVAELLDGLASEPFAYDFLQAEGRGRQLDGRHVAHWWKQTRHDGELSDQLDQAVTRNSKGEVAADDDPFADKESSKPTPAEEFFEETGNGDLATVKRLLKHSPSLVHVKDEYGRRPLNVAVDLGDIEICRFLLANGANVNAYEKGKSSPPIFDAESGAMTRLLIQHGAELDVRQHRSEHTPLQAAADDGAFEVVEALMEAGETLDFDSAVRLGWAEDVARLLDEKPWLVKLPRKPLTTAIRHGSPQLVALLLERGADPNADEEISNFLGPYTPISAAVEQNDLEITKMLLDRGADPIVGGGRNHANLFLFVIAYRDQRFVKAMLEGGADVDTTDRWNRVTPLHVVAGLGGGRAAGRVIRVGQPQAFDDGERLSIEKAKLLLEFGADPNAETEDGATPLLFAAMAGNLKLGDVLMEGGAKLDIYSACSLGKQAEVAAMLKANPQLARGERHPLERSPLHFAAIGGDIGIVRRLLELGADPNAGAPELRSEDAGGLSAESHSRGETPLHMAARYGHADIVRELIDAGAKVDAKALGYRDRAGPTPLRLACSYGQLEAVRVLLEKGAKVDVDDDSPLRAALFDHRVLRVLLDARSEIDLTGEFGTELLVTAVDAGIQATTRLLLARGAKLDIFSASILGRTDVVRQLLEGDPTLAQATRYRDPSYAVVLAAQQGHTEIVRLLIEKGAPVDVEALDGWSLPHQAAQNGHKELLNWLLAEGTKLTAKDDQGATLLHAAASGARPDMIEYLLAQGADPNATDASGQTPLHATGTGVPGDRPKDTPEMQERRVARTAQVLLRAGADVNARDKYGWTPLHRAAVHGLTDFAEMLLVAGAEVNARAKRNETALVDAELAPVYGYVERDTTPVIELLRKHGGTR